MGAVLLVAGLSVLSWIEQDDGRHSFGHAGGTAIKIVQRS
jgi:solute carrier family 7 (cationic amino acid transporter), member 1